MVCEHIHWYVTSRCNLDCSYCFKPDAKSDESKERLEALARILVDNDVKRVTIGGGEPNLIDLESALKVLNDYKIYLSYHTNAVDLDAKKLKGLVDDIAVPIDSVSPKTQEKLRGKNFLKTFFNLGSIADEIAGNYIDVGYHTVFTDINAHEIPDIYRQINKKDFLYWRIYEFNYDLAMSRILQLPIPSVGQERLRAIDRLRGKGSYYKGFTDCLYAKFLLMEQQMMEHNDSRIKFVGRTDSSPSYAFLDNTGNISFYAWFSDRERRVVGNIFNEGLPSIKRKLQELEEKQWEFDDQTENEFLWATVGNLPLWARLENGDYSDEEYMRVYRAFMPEVEKLAELYKKREERIRAIVV